MCFYRNGKQSFEHGYQARKVFKKDHHITQYEWEKKNNVSKKTCGSKFARARDGFRHLIFFLTVKIEKDTQI